MQSSFKEKSVAWTSTQLIALSYVAISKAKKGSAGWRGAASAVENDPASLAPAVETSALGPQSGSPASETAHAAAETA